MAVGKIAPKGTHMAGPDDKKPTTGQATETPAADSKPAAPTAPETKKDEKGRTYFVFKNVDELRNRVTEELKTAPENAKATLEEIRKHAEEFFKSGQKLFL